jgi:fumarate reductase subunit C
VINNDYSYNDLQESIWLPRILYCFYFILQVCHCNRSIEYYSCKWLEFPHRDNSPITGFKKRTTYGISNYFKIKANVNKHKYNKTKQTYWWTKTKFSNMFELISSLVEISGRVVTGVHGMY